NGDVDREADGTSDWTSDGKANVNADGKADGDVNGHAKGNGDGDRAVDAETRRPGAILPAEGEVEINAGRATVRLIVQNTGDRPIQVGSHYHFFEVNRALAFDRARAYGHRLNIPAGT